MSGAAADRLQSPLAALAFALAALGCGAREPAAVAVPGRIVSLAPSVTETLFALGVGDRVVGVTRFCDVPAEARSRSSVGGYLDPDYETIVTLQPDLVVLIEPQGEVERRLVGLGLVTLRVDQGDVAAILGSFEEIASRCGVADRGHALRADTEARLETLRLRSLAEPPRVLLAVERPVGSGRVTSVWAAAPGTFLDDLLRLAGGVNAVPGGPAAFPELSREGLVALDPDVILDLQPDLVERGLDPEVVRRDWRTLGELSAVRGGRVHVLAGDYMVVPGPRLAQAAEAIHRAIHGEPGEAP